MNALNVYRLEFGAIEYFVVAKDEDDAYRQGMDPVRFPDMHFLPFTIRKVEVPGYVITARPVQPEKPPQETEQIVQSGSRGRKPAGE